MKKLILKIKDVLWCIPNYIFRKSNYQILCDILKYIQQELEDGNDNESIKLLVTKKFGLCKNFHIYSSYKPMRRIEIFIGGFYGFVVKRDSDGKFIALFA